MGGRAFTSSSSTRPTIRTPRLSLSVYINLRDELSKRLGTLFARIACPAEAPGKIDYGDIDFVVTEPVCAAFDSIWEGLNPNTQQSLARQTDGDRNLAILLYHVSAKYFIKGGKTTSLAVPHPGDGHAFVQLDISECSAELFAWQAFHSSYGDLWSIIGTSLKPSGLTVSEGGMFIRDSMIENLDRKKAMTLLTHEPRTTLQFLGMHPDEWEEGWPDESSMFKYATTCRFFTPSVYLDVSVMKSSDRKRLAKRPCFARFVNEYVPELLGLPTGKECKRQDEEKSIATIPLDRKGPGGSLNRESVLNEALETFKVGELFHLNRAKWVENIAKLEERRALRTQRRLGHEPGNISYGK